MAAPTLSLATLGSTKKSSHKRENSASRKAAQKDSNLKNNPSNGVSSKASNDSKLGKKFWGEEINEDSIYSIYLKKITYSFNGDTCIDSLKSSLESKQEKEPQFITRSDQVDGSGPSDRNEVANNPDVQCLQWETRQTRILKAATLDHLVKYILLLTSHQQHNNEMKNSCNNSFLEEERNNVAHAMHVLFCTYRLYHTPYQLFSAIIKYTQECCLKQFNFVLHYWLDNYPEDFKSPIFDHQNSANSKIEAAEQTSSSSQSDSELSSKSTSSDLNSSSSDTNDKNLTLVDALLSLSNIDDSIYRKGLSILEMKKESSPDIISTNQKSISKNSSVLDLDSRFISQQLTAIDLENFLSLKPYSLLCGSRSTSKIQHMIKNFNLLSRHVIITILKAHSPHVVAAHWIEVALQLRKIRNFNSLKAIIAGLTNESVYRLKQTVWSKLSRASLSTFKWLSTIVDDVNNQTLLRHTQLIIEGTSKVSIEDESFGTIPYLGTFLTDITMINTRYQNYIQTETNKRLINFEKCSHQYEILMQIQLLQKNVIAALTAIQQQSQQMGRSYLPTQTICSPTIPRVARIFRIWFQGTDIASVTDKECYHLSLALESSPVKNKSL